MKNKKIASFLQERRELLVDQMDQFSKEMLTRALNEAWNNIGCSKKEAKTKLEPAVETLIGYSVQMSIPAYFNEGVKKMITNDPDKHFMEAFTKMKETLNHGYRCLINLTMGNTQATFQELDLKKLKYNPQKKELENVSSVLDEIFAKRKALKVGQVNHICEYRDEDITKWDPNEPFFYMSTSPFPSK